MNSWPTILPPPSVDFSGKTASNVVRSGAAQVGYTSQWRRFTAELFTFSVTWTFTDFEFGMFQSWVLYKVNSGSDFFSIALPTGGAGLKTVTARIVEGKYSHKYVPHKTWVVSASLEVENILSWSEAYYDSIVTGLSATDWPDIFPAPSIDFNGTVDPNNSRVQMSSGRYRQQRGFTSEQRVYPTSWHMTDLQFGLFQSWVLHKIAGGQNFFTINIPTGGDGFVTVSARIVAGKYSFKYIPFNEWNVSANLEVLDSLTWSEQDYDSLLTIGDLSQFELAVDRIHRFIYH